MLLPGRISIALVAYCIHPCSASEVLLLGSMYRVQVSAWLSIVVPVYLASYMRHEHIRYVVVMTLVVLDVDGWYELVPATHIKFHLRAIKTGIHRFFQH